MTTTQTAARNQVPGVLVPNFSIVKERKTQGGAGIATAGKKTPADLSISALAKHVIDYIGHGETGTIDGNLDGDRALRDHAAAILNNERAKKRKPAGRHPDHALISHAIEYVAHMKGADAGYNVDPTDSDIAAPFDTKHRAVARLAFSRLTKLKANTIDGLRAKAAVMEHVAYELSQFAADGTEVDFLRS
ncbi:MAG: hypothetical protein G4V63_33025, partial [Candidatus Afipia apatlaquensis]|nr:hypothetical protein [Candidatus Afipia apatlaquensis]